MHFSTKYTARTDLADEVLENLYGKKGEYGDGIDFKSKNLDGFRVDTVNVQNQKASEATGKPVGRYVTVETGEIWKKDAENMARAGRVVSQILKSMMPKNGLCLAVCLGNDRIIADAVGPFAARNIIVTRHIKRQAKQLYESLCLGETACIVPGVMGNTGAEAAELVLSAVKMLEPSSVIVIDALACRKLSRLAKTVQITDSGICPGSGVDNARGEISQKTLGVPTIALGVPTVVDASTLCADIIDGVLDKENSTGAFLQQHLSENPSGFFVTPKETDRIIGSMSKLLGYAVNVACHGDMSLSEMEEFLS